jgi:hypothetical protein
VIVILSTELMRQADPAKVTRNSAPGPATNEAAGSGGAIASPADSPQALPAPAAAPPVIQPAPAQTARAEIQHNTGTDPAP